MLKEDTEKFVGETLGIGMEMVKSLMGADLSHILRSKISQMSKQQNSFGNYKLLSNCLKRFVYRESRSKYEFSRENESIRLW